jgi:hypothetical protein
MTKPIDWQDQLKRDVDFARTALLKQGSLMPMFILHCPDEVRIVGAGWADDTEKRRAQQMVGLMALAANATAISFISEAWSRAVMRHPRETEAEHQARIDAVRPAEAEDRTEVLIVSLTYRENNERHSLVSTLDMMRTVDGTLTEVIEREAVDAEFGGAMTDLLCPVETTPDIRTAAQVLIEAFCKKHGIDLQSMQLKPETLQ